MATVLPPTTPQEEDERYNVANDLYNAEFNEGAKTPTGEDTYANSGIDQLESFANDPANAVRKRENDNFDYEPSANKGAGQQVKNPIKALNILKKGGPFGLIIAVIGGAMGLLTSFTPLLPFHVYQSLLEKFDSQSTSYNIRTQKVLAAKLTNSATEGTCTTFVSIRCRFTRPSNYLLKNLETNNIEAFDKKGNKITKNGLWPNTRPASYSYAGGDKISSKNFLTTMRSDANFRAAFNTANRTRLQTFSDSVFKRVAARFGFTKEDKLKDAKTEKDVKETINESSAGDDKGVKTAAADEKKGILKGLLSDEATGETTKLADSGRGNLVGLAAGAVCLGMDGPGIITRTARAYQMAQLVKFAMVNMVAINALMAGDGTQEEANTISNALTATDSKGNSALDSFGMKYSLYGDTGAAKDDNYEKYVPGGATAAIFGGAALIFDSQAKKSICAGATSPVTGAIIDAALGPETLGIGTAINIVAGVAASLVIGAVAGPLIDAALSAIPATVYEQIGSMFFGDITANLADADYGNALASGTAHTYGQVSNAGGNVPLSVNDAVAYDGLTQQVNLAYAQEDRATHSPLDASNSNTFMGSIVNQLIPLYSQMGSITSVLSSVGSITSTSVTGLFMGNTYAATNETAQYKLCNDPSITNTTGDSVAAGPFCNLQYGIPTKYLNMDSQTVVDKLVAAGQIDPNTGEAIETADDFAADAAGAVGVDTSSTITSYYKWQQLCLDGTSAQAENCKIGGSGTTSDVNDPIHITTAAATNKPSVKLAADSQSGDDLTALYAVYTIDHRIQKNMDDEDTDPVDDSNSTSSTAVTGGTKQELAKAILDSGKVSFLPGNGSSDTARKKIFSDIADGKTDGNALPCGLNLKVLQAVKEVVDNHSSVGIGDTNSLCTGASQGRSAGSRHIAGNGSALDFYMLDGTALNGSNAKSLELLRELKPQLSKGSTLHDRSQVGQVECRNYIDLGNVSQFADACSHVHIDFPPWDDPNLKYQTAAY